MSNRTQHPTNEVQLSEPQGFNFWPWFVFGLPMLTVVAGIITYQIAAGSPDPVVQDNYYKKGLAINQSFIKDKQAATWQLVAELKLELEQELEQELNSKAPATAAQLESSEVASPSANRLLLITLNSNASQTHSNAAFRLPEQLFLEFFHPTQSRQDIKLQLNRLIANEYVAQLPPLVNSHWHIRLSDPTNHWQLKSRWSLTEKHKTLAFTANND